MFKKAGMTYLIFSLVLGITTSCKNRDPDSPSLSTPMDSIDFLNEKYSAGYRLNLDGSTISDHPFYDYIDCKKEGFFSVHFIAKNQKLRSYWKNEFLAQATYDYDDTSSENNIIKEKLEGNFKDYNIFACHITQNYIAYEQECTEEAISFIPASMTDIYSYNVDEKQWKLLESRPTDKLPIYYHATFFEENFSALFQKENDSDHTESLSLYENSPKYFITKVDVNQDGIKDVIVSSKAYEGDELIFFIKERESFQLRLRTINLSQDGGSIIDSIYAPQSNKGVLAIKTIFPDGGYLTATHYINYKNNDWTLNNTVYETKESTEKEITTYTCDVVQNLLLKKLIQDEYAAKVKYLPSEDKREKECTKEVTKLKN